MQPRFSLYRFAKKPRIVPWMRSRRPFSSQAPESDATQSSTTRLHRRRRARLLYVWYGVHFFGGLAAGLTVRNFVSPSLPAPGSREDELTLAALNADVDQLDVVKDLRSQSYNLHEDTRLSASGEGGRKGWMELDVKGHILEAKDNEAGHSTRTFTSECLAGSKGLGVQRAFWNAETRELVAVVWIGPALSGWPMLAHGGAIATIFEDCMARMVAGPDASLDSMAAPASMSVTYAVPTWSANFYVLRASFSSPQLPQVAPPVDPEPAPAKSWLPSWKDLTKKEPPASSSPSSQTLEITGTLESVKGELCVRAKGTFAAPS